MKRTYQLLLACIMLAIFTFAVTSCNDDEEVTYTKLTVEIDSEQCEYFNINTGSRQPGMWVTEAGKNNWKEWSQTAIEGFTFEEGYYTKLLINKRTDNKQNGIDGASSNAYQLLKLIEKTESESVRGKR
ncbi:MAG: DUF4377 domain-containing protein [Bacteroidales bacterium]|nr:DUF4377 domain-containing protein [Candidatus Liminaster caballi]